ncbi:hypothetical protein FHW68_001726 [Pseudomonas sp. Tn43]|uniref:hypothetical protein n=1 Tax=Pseudomonas sp. Tn43 TaxID=701213 RepID=UPI00161D5162|nr:hypothetical protein [Pseudomonas sp. Tn43]MBB3240235.1 hypothetical protein [Pseudomonas sp. Tn43]
MPDSVGISGWRSRCKNTKVTAGQGLSMVAFIAKISWGAAAQPRWKLSLFARNYGHNKISCKYDVYNIFWPAASAHKRFGHSHGCGTGLSQQ